MEFFYRPSCYTLAVKCLIFAVLLFTLSGPFACCNGSQEEETRVRITPHKPAFPATTHPVSLRADVNLVLVPVTVTDALDRPVTTLSKEDFRVLDDGAERTVASLSREDGPLSVGLLFDTSGSMKNRIASSVDALKEFFQTTMPGDEFFVVQFADRARLLGGFTAAPDEIYARLGFVQPRGWTALLDAVGLGTHQMKSAKNRRRVLLVLSDGNDNNSRFSESEIKSMVVEGDLQVYAICLYYRPHLLRELADETGGKVLVVRHDSELPDTIQRLSAAIRTQYMLGYTLESQKADGKYHKVHIQVAQPPGNHPLRVSWRRGYYAPDNEPLPSAPN